MVLIKQSRVQEDKQEAVKLLDDAIQRFTDAKVYLPEADRRHWALTTAYLADASREKGKKMEDMLIAGEIPAAIGVKVDSPDVKPLIPKPRDAGFAALRERGLYPINHTVVIRNDVLAAHPRIAMDLFKLFAAAKQPYLERLAAGQIDGPEDQFFRDVMDVIGDPLPYGIPRNRAMLEAVIGHAVEQGIIPERVNVDDLFAV